MEREALEQPQSPRSLWPEATPALVPLASSPARRSTLSVHVQKNQEWKYSFRYFHPDLPLRAICWTYLSISEAGASSSITALLQDSIWQLEHAEVDNVLLRLEASFSKPCGHALLRKATQISHIATQLIQQYSHCCTRETTEVANATISGVTAP
jgi:hypothetical protein